MFYRGIGEFGEYCGRFFGRSPMFYHSPWGILLGILGLAVVVTAVVLIVKAAGRGKKDDSDEMLEILKSRYVSGEINEEEYLKKRKILKK